MKRLLTQIVIGIAGVSLLCLGVFRGEAVMLLRRAAYICLECIGIG
jgi:hypothetical protein